MKKITSLFTFLFFTVFTQVGFGQIATFNFTSSPLLTVTSKDANVTVTNISLSTGTIDTNVSTGTYFPNPPYIEELGVWTATEQSSAKNFTFTISANEGYEFSITNISFNAYATDAGPSAFSAEIDGTNLATINARKEVLETYNQVVTKSGLNSAVIKIQGWLNGSRVSTGGGMFKLDDIIIAGSVNAIPVISVNPTTLSYFVYNFENGPSSEQSFLISGSDLTADITLLPPTNYEISTGTGGSFVASNPITLAQSSGTVNGTTIFVRLKAELNVGAYVNEDITASSTGASDKTFTGNGTVIANHLVIAEIYGGGGNSGAPYTYDYIALYNPTSSSIDLSNWSVQYTSYNGTSWNSTPLTGSVAANKYYLIQEADGSNVIADLPVSPNVIGTIEMSATGGKVLLSNQQTELSGAKPTANVIDFVGYGSAVSYEGSNPAASPSNTTSIRRKSNAYTNDYGGGNGFDTDDNFVDFFVETNLNANTPVPVQLTTFTAKSTKTGVVLNWATETEVNNYGFQVESQILNQVQNDKSSWEKVGFVEGHGNSNSPKEYSFYDNSGATSYRLKQIDFNGGYEYSDIVTVSASLAKTKLFQNSPNPFNPSTKISFALAEAGKVNVSVYNVIGQRVAELVNKHMESGIHNVDFNASKLSSGFYIYKLETPNFVKTMKMVLIK